jgi:polyisoprenoid-binding protein YceI
VSARAARLAVTLALLGAAGAAGASTSRWTASPGKSRILVQVFKRGLLSGLAHDHHFEATVWRASATLDPASPAEARIEVVVEAGSLQDRQEALSAPDRAKVNLQAAGPETLDAARFPQIRFVADRLDLAAGASSQAGQDLDGVLVGTLSLHGQERPLAVPVHLAREGETWRVRGAVRLKQSDYGISPFSGFLGTVAVHDELVIEYDLVLAPLQ